MKDSIRHSTPRSKVSASLQGLSLLLVQSIVCIFAIIAMLCMRWFSGTTFDSITSLFQKAMLEDTLITAVTEVVSPTKAVAKGIEHDNNAIKKIVAPLSGGVLTSRFGERDGSFHEGVDIAAAEGTPLKAMMTGTVTTAAFEQDGYGHYVVVTCDNNEKYLYAHCSQLTVCVGDVVCAGDTIGFVGDTGRSSGSHVHIEWIYKDVETDPLTVLPRETYV